MKKRILSLSKSSIFVSDMLCINNDQLMDSVMQDIYPKELELTSDDAVTSTHYLDWILKSLVKRSTTTCTTSVMLLDSRLPISQTYLETFQLNRAMEFLLHS